MRGLRGRRRRSLGCFCSHRRSGVQRRRGWSGYLLGRGNRRRRNFDRGFVISDHADWPDLLRSIEQTGARRILATHGSSDALVRHLRERGLGAEAMHTGYGAEE